MHVSDADAGCMQQMRRNTARQKLNDSRSRFVAVFADICTRIVRLCESMLNCEVPYEGNCVMLNLIS